ncbi:MAG: hypothetical protein KKA84_06530 [Bacteroidetes bacterium]|nr:hypothetical protein [Bacteroidota bacterium]
MINKNEFYSDKDTLSTESKNALWDGIQKELFPRKDFFSMFDVKSYTLGFTTAIIFLFAVIGMYTVGKSFLYENKPDELIINSAYQKAIIEFEEALPRINKVGNTVRVDEFLQVKQEELKEIDVAIEQYGKDYSKNDYSQLKQERLRRLYKLKLKVLESIIAIEGTDHETNN